MRNQAGFTLVELLIVLAIVTILAIIGVPQINRFSADYKVRTAATDILQNMRVARAMAIKENRPYIVVFDTVNSRYLIGFDGDNDSNLLTPNSDTFGICKDTDNDRLPNGDVLVNGVPQCVRVVNLSDSGANISFGYAAGTTPPNGPPNAQPTTIVPVPSGITFGGNPAWARFNADGSTPRLGTVYLQQTSRGLSYAVIVSNTAGSINVRKWDGDKDNTGVVTWGTQDVR